MDDDNSASTSAGIVIGQSDVAEVAQNTLLNNSSSVVNYPPDDEDLDDAAATVEATRDTLADGLVARLLRPCVDRLDASVQSTRLSQLDLKVQLDSLAAELKSLSLAQNDYLLTTASIPSPQSPVASDNKTSPTAILNKVAMDTCVLLDGHANRLSCARAKIAVVGNILESTQDRLRALSHRIGREHNNRRSLLEPQIVQTSVMVEESKQEGECIEELNFQDSDSPDLEKLPTDDINKIPPEDQVLQQSIVNVTSPTLS
ncbi:Snapin/Pallidin/Snn1 [Cinara cedri]|uniref:Biogenesis of lysosome-related organelles complex 1 subunit 7 n=1 Tax=Cinara cedri TaxID=506608 RepID=A0A5E4N0B4_9HEMI|nr:Snapin/Pallidin/Snn1 [Cinara cedri]